MNKFFFGYLLGASGKEGESRGWPWGLILLVLVTMMLSSHFIG